MDPVTIIAIVGGISLIVPRVRIFATIMGVILIAISVWLSNPTRFQGISTNNSPTTEPPSGTSVSLETPIASSNQLGCQIWKDDFSLANRWWQGKLDWVERGNIDNEYKILLYHPNYLSYACWTCDLHLDTFIASVTGRIFSGAGSWGIYFWGKGKVVYAFEIDGQTAYLKSYTDGLSDVSIIGQKDIEQLNSNRITIQYLDGFIRGYVNSREAISLQFTPSPVGKDAYGIGLSTASNTENFEVRYDDYELSGCP